ncbi:hypothetical protein [Aeromonas salmonicida]|uniref:hypothetical protein n=1 Tax=Aeromonas salmonicida TaxID=645 RepID=UPI00259DC5B8|nr:hypothetical protein [Aeromonas salmonicida]MDM5114348.1 hypothetical protein [Aeromonas salmonicida]
MEFKSRLSPWFEVASDLLPQPNLPISEVISILQSRPGPSPISEEEALFSDFDETVARLKAFDLETDIEPEEGEPFTLSTFGNNQHDVK